MHTSVRLSDTTEIEVQKGENVQWINIDEGPSRLTLFFSSEEPIAELICACHQAKAILDEQRKEHQENEG